MVKVNNDILFLYLGWSCCWSCYCGLPPCFLLVPPLLVVMSILLPVSFLNICISFFILFVRQLPLIFNLSKIEEKIVRMDGYKYKIFIKQSWLSIILQRKEISIFIYLIIHLQTKYIMIIH